MNSIIRQSLPILGLLVGAGPVLAQDQGDSEVLPRAEFFLAYGLARTGLPALGSDSAALQNYVLYPYLEAARLSRALPGPGAGLNAADTAVETFLSRHDGEPVAWNLRINWLNSLSERELWQPLLEHYREEVADTQLRCRQLNARIAVGDVADIAPAILDEWLTPRQLPGECEPVFQWLRDAGPLDDAMTEARVRLLLENGQPEFARIIARRLPDDRARPLLAWSDLIARPRAALEAYIARPDDEIDKAMLLDGWSRLTRDDPSAALAMYDVLITTEGLDRMGATPYTLALALGLAWDRRPEALEYFARVDASAMDDYAREWQARSALWAGDWDTVLAAIAAMSEMQSDSAAWRYWAARASASRDQRETLYASLVERDNYYAAVASARMRDRAGTHPAVHERDLITVAMLAAQPAIRRADELRRVGLPEAAMREWRFAAAGFDDHQRAQSIHLALQLDWFDLVVTTATELGVFYDYALLYPQPYADEVAAAADEFDLEPSLIYAVMRQESLYRADAESSSGARGLMQLQPGTAGIIARSLGEGSAGNLDLLDPLVNIRLGAAELAQLLERFDGHIVPALAAYNAGPNAADRWLPDAPMDGDVWLENVPYNETREYVRRVLWHTVVFRSLANESVNARDWLRTIRPRPAE